MRNLDLIASLNLLEFMPLRCPPLEIETNFHSNLLARTLVPGVWFTICLAAKKGICKCGARASKIADKMMTTAFLVLFLVYPTNSQKLFSTYLCETFDEGTRALRSDWSIDCDGSTHLMYMLYALAMILHPFGPIGTPLIYYWLVHSAHGPLIRRMRENERLREQLREETLTQILLGRLEKQAQVVKELTLAKSKAPKPIVVVPTESDLPIGVVAHIDKLTAQQEADMATLPDYVKKLTSGYKMRNAGFEIFECFRKLALVCMPVAFEPGSVAQLLFGLIICFVTFGMYANVTPYEEPQANVLAQACQVQIFFTLLSSIALKHDSDKNATSERTMDVMLTVLFFLPLSLTVLLRTPLVKLLEQTERARLLRKCCGGRARTQITDALPADKSTSGASVELTDVMAPEFAPPLAASPPTSEPRVTVAPLAAAGAVDAATGVGITKVLDDLSDRVKGMFTAAREEGDSQLALAPLAPSEAGKEPEDRKEPELRA